MLTLPVTAQSLKPVSWNCRHVLSSFPDGSHFKLAKQIAGAEMTQYIKWSLPGRSGQARISRTSRTFNRLPRAVGSASVPAGDRAALVGSAKPVIISFQAPK